MKNENEAGRAFKIRIYYFSATGNTKYGLLLLQKHLAHAGHICELLSIEDESTIDNRGCDLLGFASPVYGGYPAHNMVDFIKQSTCFDVIIPAFTVLCPCSTIGYWGSRELFADILKGKNIQVISELGFLGNPSHPAVVGSLEHSSTKIRAFFNGIGRPDGRDDNEIEEFSERLIRTYLDYTAGRSIKRLKNSSLRIWSSKKINMKEKRFQISHPIMVDKDKCTQCGLCQKVCPQKAIALTPYPERDLSKCFNCQKCTNLCPRHALYLQGIEYTGQYKGAFDKIRNMNETDKDSHINSSQNKAPLALRFFSTGVGMAILLMLGRFADRKTIKEV